MRNAHLSVCPISCALRHAAVLLGALSLLATALSPALALTQPCACSTMSKGSSECLTGTSTDIDYANRKGPSYTLTNECPTFGAVKACIEFRAIGATRAQPVEHTLTSETFSRTLEYNPVAVPVITGVSAIKCCSGSDESICNRNDGISPNACVAQFNLSIASNKCWDETATVVGDSKCRIRTTCNNNIDGHGNDQDITVPYVEVSDLTADNRGYLN